MGVTIIGVSVSEPHTSELNCSFFINTLSVSLVPRPVRKIGEKGPVSTVRTCA